MPKYIVVRDFADLQDESHIYHAGDIYPRKGKPKKERLEELLGSNNRIGKPVIVEAEEGDK